MFDGTIQKIKVARFIDYVVLRCVAGQQSVQQVVQLLQNCCQPSICWMKHWAANKHDWQLLSLKKSYTCLVKSSSLQHLLEMSAYLPVFQRKSFITMITRKWSLHVSIIPRVPCCDSFAGCLLNTWVTEFSATIVFIQPSVPSDHYV